MFDRPLEPFRTKAELVYEQLCSAIISGRARPGDRLNVDEISRSLQVSKIPVREAVQRLETQGIVVQTPHAGARVAPLSLRELRGIFLIRERLEGLATGLAASAITTAGLDKLRDLHRRMAADLAAGDLERLSTYNLMFHAQIAAAAGHETLEEFIQTTLLRIARYRSVVSLDVVTWRSVVDEHTAILAALERRDPEAAEEAAIAHVLRQAEADLRRHVDQLDLADPGVAPVHGVA